MRLAVLAAAVVALAAPASAETGIAVGQAFVGIDLPGDPPPLAAPAFSEAYISSLSLCTDRLGECEALTERTHSVPADGEEEWAAVVRCERTGDGQWLARANFNADGGALTLETYTLPSIPRRAVVIEPGIKP